MSAELTEGASVSRYARMEISTGRPVKIGKNNKKKFKYAKKVKWGGNHAKNETISKNR